MANVERLELLELHLSLVEAATRAVAYGSPSPLEEYRASLNGEVLELRREQDPDAEENVQVEDPAEEDDAFEDRKPDPDVDEDVLAEPPENVDVAEAPAVVLPPSEAEPVGQPSEDVSTAPSADQAPGEALNEAVKDAEDANPAGIDSRGDVGPDRPEVTEERKQENLDAITPPDGQDHKAE